MYVERFPQYHLLHARKVYATYSSLAAVPLLYAGICSSGIAYTLQIVGQKGTDPTIATMLLSLESIFSVLAGMVLLHQMLSLREIFGCVLIFAAVIAAQYEKKE